MRRRAGARLYRGLLTLAAGLLLAGAGPQPGFVELFDEIVKLSAQNDIAAVTTKVDGGLARYAEPGPERAMLLGIRAAILEDAEKPAEALVIMDQAVAMLPDEADFRLRHASLQRQVGKNVDAARTIIFLTDAFPSEVESLNVRWIGSLIRDLADDREARFELELALASRGYDVEGEPGRVDWIVADAILGLIERDRVEEAPALVPRLIAASTLIEMMVDRRYQPLWPTLEAKVGRRFEAALAAERAAIEAAWRHDPDNIERVTDYANSLHAAGRPLDAVNVGAAFVADMARIEQQGEHGFWLVNAHAQALAGAGKVDEADALFRKLVALGLEKHPYLISMAINHSSLLLDQLRDAPALEAADKIDALAPGAMSDYGQMWVWKTQTCASAALGQTERSRTALAKMQAMQDKNVAATMLALLCTDQLDAAEQLLIMRLADPDKRSAMLTALQDFEPAPADPFTGAMRAKLLALRARPTVRKAIEAHGRILSIAAAHAHWGGF
jgi:tetratricopeptide (TPR) repeat protein